MKHLTYLKCIIRHCRIYTAKKETVIHKVYTIPFICMLKKQTANSLSRCLTELHCCRQQSSVKVFCDDVTVMLCVTADYIMCMHEVWLSLVQGHVLTFIYSYAHGEIYQGVYSYCCVVRIAINL